ncbi:hypothetical protein FOZ63_026660 [Perkinsus olseni]|uniref:Uncharacterized protein n=1 Tax=Perkinsus olseni TaxID=32597 RepID=A0A7J6UEG4_PEROL|nr:hypothetical protein FOZ63_026660 [Perkinsus olseni]
MASLGVPLAVREATKSDYKLARLTVVYTATIREHLTSTINNLKLGLKAIDNGVDPVWPMPARQERRAWRVTYNKGPHHHGKFAVEHYVFHDWRYKFTFHNVGDPRPVISTVLGSLSGDAAVTCDFAWYFPGTEEYLSDTRKTQEAQEDTKELLFQGYEHYLKANYVDMEHRKTCKADGRWSSLRRDTGSVARGLGHGDFIVLDGRHTDRAAPPSPWTLLLIASDTEARVTVTEEPAPCLRMAAHHGRMPAQEIVYQYNPLPREERSPRPTQEPEGIDTPALVRPSHCDPSIGEGYCLSMATRIEDDAAAIDQRIEALQAEIERLSRPSPVGSEMGSAFRDSGTSLPQDPKGDGADHRLKVITEELSALGEQWQLQKQGDAASVDVEGTSGDRSGPSAEASKLQEIAKQVEEMEVVLGLRPLDPSRPGQEHIVGPAVAGHIDLLYDTALRLLRQSSCLEKHFTLDTRWSERDSTTCPEVLHASGVFTEVIDRRLRFTSLDNSSHTEEILRLQEKYDGLGAVLDGLVGTCESLQARGEYLRHARRFVADLRAVEERSGRLQKILNSLQ